MEGLNLRHVPQLASRPDFPRGLRVVLLEPDADARAAAEAQLCECSYTVTVCSDAQEAAQHLSNPEHHVDVLLLDAKCLQARSADVSTLVAAAKLLPLVLTSDSSNPDVVYTGIQKFGAVDILEKPLSLLKLKNLWQHTVRRLMSSAAPNHLHLMKKGAHPAALQHHVPTQQAAAQQTRDATGVRDAPASSSPEHSSAGTSHGSGGESGSNASTSDRAHVKIEMDLDIEASSLHGISQSMLLGSMDALHNLAVSCLPQSAAAPHEAMEFDPASSNTCSKHCRSGRIKLAVGRKSNPSLSSGAIIGAEPVIGHPAGQMPALPNLPGITWGLPTNPLQISPKASPMMGLMGPWPCPIPGAVPGVVFPPFLFSGAPPCPALPSVTSAGSLMPLAAPSSSISGPAPPAPIHQPLSMAQAMKRAESAPPSLLNFGEPFTLQPPKLQHSATTGLFLDMELETGMLDKPNQAPIGLSLKKSPSLADFISQSLKTPPLER